LSGEPCIALKEFPVKDGRVVIRGVVCTAAGFQARSPARLIRHSDALVVAACDEAVMAFRVGSPSLNQPYRSIGLARTPLEGATRVLAAAYPGRVVLTAADTSASSAAPGVAPESEVPLPETPPMADVACYSRPAGKRLQIQGRWLREFGFEAGARYIVTGTTSAVRVELCAAGTGRVTEMRPGTSKLYVPAALVHALGAGEVRVRACVGVLELVAA
jgi:hypothetical protein